jgi:hypothetical protein
MKQTLCLGIDGFDWDLATQLIAQNKLPNLQGLLAKGAGGPMDLVLGESLAASWATTLCGDWPDQHGILGDLQPLPSGEGTCITRSSSAEQPFIWDLISDPPVAVQVLAHAFVDSDGDGMAKFVHGDYPGKAQYGGTWPSLKPDWLHGFSPDEIALFADMLIDPSAVPISALIPFIPQLENIDAQKDRRPAIIAHGIAHTLSVHNLLTWQIQASPSALTVSAYPLFTDLCSQFLAYQGNGLSIADNSYYYREVVAATYGFFDVLLGRLLELLDEEGSLVLVSHHGYKQSSTGPKAAHMHRLARPLAQGFCLFAGKHIKPGSEWLGAGQLDVVPTLLTLVHQPVPDKLPGRVLSEFLDTHLQVRYIHQERLNAPQNWPAFKKSAQNRDFIQQLAEQGYRDPLSQLMDQQRLNLDRERLLNICKVHTLKAEQPQAITHLSVWIKKHPSDLHVLLRLLFMLVIRNNNASLTGLARQALDCINQLSDKQFTQQVPNLSRQVLTTLLDGLILYGQGDEDNALDYLIRLNECHNEHITQ